MSLTRDLAEAVCSMKAPDLAAGELTALRALTLDFIGVAARGASTAPAVHYRRAIGSMPQPAGGLCPVIGTADSMSAVTAAMFNAFASHSIEYDDVHNASSLHPAVVVFPAALAAASLAPAALADPSDERFVLGVVAGYEVMCRVGAAAQPQGHYARHFHPTGTAGALGAAAAAGIVLGLDAGELTSALGIAETGASGTLTFLTDGAGTKPLNPALAARTGIEAAWLASAGFVGPADPIAGPHGFLNSFSDNPDPRLLLDGWGADPLAITSTSIKAHTCCRYNQGPIDALLLLMAEHDLSPADVASVLIGVPTTAVDIVAEPRDDKRRPKTIVDAQFSLPFAAAVALTYGRAGLGEYSADTLQLGGIAGLMDKVDYVVDPSIDRDFPQKWRAWAVVSTADGRRLEAHISEPKGDPGNPLTADELRAKFCALTQEIYGEPQQESIITLSSRLGEPDVLQELLAALTTDGEGTAETARRR